MEINFYPEGSVGYLRQWRKDNNIEVDIYKEGSKLFVKEIFDSFTTSLSIESVSIDKDNNFIESDGGLEARHQVIYVINCFDYIGSENFTNEFVFNQKEVKSGDVVYVLIIGTGESYGDTVLGVFTEKPTDDIIKKYVEHTNKLLPKDDVCNRLEDDEYHISRIVEIKVS